MKDKSFSHTKFNIALASVISIFIGAIIYVPVLKFSQAETEIVYQKVPVPVFINITPVNNHPEFTLGEDEYLETETGAVEESEVYSNLFNTGVFLTKELRTGDTDPEVKILQKFLNENGFTVSSSGPGSPGNETEFFGRNTRDSLIRFQESHADIILKPRGLENGTGVLDDLTRKVINS